ncbi:DUF4408 domain protein [Quillaja saponaria]|uniref:DUF4408 domain protein n=1 Tax=Quillaja saponaria TaxID=32244 RepID=A0AAD7QD63_QUISA|nr:DUF4408 domain protein [Quillaja saponaria]KAJ7979350.1 DUF4408 domain protein [Quillaja saponaria]
MAALSSITSLFAFLASWVTPTSLFLFLNLVIGTIVLTSRFGTQKRPQQQVESDNSYQLVRAPSLLERVRSINFSHYKFELTDPETEHLQPAEPENLNPYPYPDNSPQHQIARTPSLLERLKSINFPSLYRSDSTNSENNSPHSTETQGSDRDSGQGRGNLVKRSKSETGAESQVGSSEKIKKSISEKSALGFCEKEDKGSTVERRQAVPARTERISSRASETASLGYEEEVDAKADDFINRFKEQLRLQRLDSLLRYREMLRRN